MRSLFHKDPETACCLDSYFRKLPKVAGGRQPEKGRVTRQKVQGGAAAAQVMDNEVYMQLEKRACVTVSQTSLCFLRWLVSFARNSLQRMAPFPKERMGPGLYNLPNLGRPILATQQKYPWAQTWADIYSSISRMTVSYVSSFPFLRQFQER